MADITIVNGVYKPTNITGGHHPATSSIYLPQTKVDRIPALHCKLPKGSLIISPQKIPL